MGIFQYDPAIMTAFPHTVGGIVVGWQIQNTQSPDELKALYLQEQSRVKQQIGTTPLSQIPSLASWRQTFRKFDVDPTKYRSAPESLLRRLTKKGDIPLINILVDIGNLISIRYALPVAVFDARAIEGGITVHIADGSERYIQLYEEELVHPDQGEVVFSDKSKMVVARRWCWRQSHSSAANSATRRVVITIEAQHENGKNDVQLALDDLLALLNRFGAGNFQSAILSSETPSLEHISNKFSDNFN